MTKYEIDAIQASLFSPTLIENNSFVINRQADYDVESYHNCLMNCPAPHVFLNNNVGISDELIKRFKIGFVDRAVFEPNTNSLCLRDCFTLPLKRLHGEVGVYGLRYQCHHVIHQAQSYISYGNMPVYAPFLSHSVALLINCPFTALALSESGYTNAISALGNGITPMTLSAVAQHGITHLVVFTHAHSNIQEIDESEALASRYSIKLSKVALPFRVTYVGKWDEYQWKLFDKRLSAALEAMGMQNLRCQA